MNTKDKHGSHLSVNLGLRATDALRRLSNRWCWTRSTTIAQALLWADADKGFGPTPDPSPERLESSRNDPEPEVASGDTPAIKVAPGPASAQPEAS